MVWKWKLQPHELYNLWNSSGQNTGVGSLSMLYSVLKNSKSLFCTPETNVIFEVNCTWIFQKWSTQGYTQGYINNELQNQDTAWHQSLSS